MLPTVVSTKHCVLPVRAQHNKVHIFNSIRIVNGAYLIAVIMAAVPHCKSAESNATAGK
jgi:hypothetical protein